MFSAYKWQCAGRVLIWPQAICIARNANKSNNLGARGNWFAAMPPATSHRTPPHRSLPLTAPSRNFSTRLNIYCLMDVIVIK